MQLYREAWGERAERERRERADGKQPALAWALGADKFVRWGGIKWCVHRAVEAPRAEGAKSRGRVKLSSRGQQRAVGTSKGGSSKMEKRREGGMDG